MFAVIHRFAGVTRFCSDQPRATTMAEQRNCYAADMGKRFPLAGSKRDFPLFSVYN